MSKAAAPVADRLRQYCRWWAQGLLGLAAAAIGVAVVADPYFVLGTPLIEGLNRSKPATVERAGLAKAYLLPRVAPATLLLGTSKVECGIDPASPSLPRGAAPVFNGGVPGTDVRYAFAQLRDATRVAPVRRALLVLEITEFLSPPQPGDEQPPGPFLPDPRRRTKDIFSALLSRDALQDSVGTFVAQRGAPSGLDSAGLLADDFFMRSIRREGAAALYEQKLPTELATLDRINERLHSDRRTGAAGLAWVSRVIAFSRSRGIALDIAIAPVHADLLRLIDRKGLWPRVPLVKRLLTETVERDGRGEVALWDFVRFDHYSTEPLPPPGVTIPMTWFWEPNHFRRALGEKMLQTIYRGSRDFGFRLTSDTLAATLARDEEARRRDILDARGENARLTRQLGALAPRGS